MAQRAKNKPELKIVVSNSPEPQAVDPAPEQVEMPFAIVNGEPVTQMPKDLYIPPQAMEVFLEAFEGPLDLLLYLIRRQNLNILDIPLAEITRQYMKYIEVMTELQLELAGEYMVMAATLAEIKSRMLLPRPKVDLEGNEEDPRAELVRRLQEYERFKRAAEGIDALPRLERDVWQASAELKDRKVVRLLPTVTLQEMLLAFKDVVVRSEMFAHHHIQRERLSVRERMGNILTTLEQASFVEFIRLFHIEEGRMGVTVTFMALLELVREGLIEIVQAEPFAPIHVRAAGAGRKLHVVGGNEALAEEPAVVVAEPVVGVIPAVEVTELFLDPNFVDEDEEEDGLLEGVDDVVDQISSAPAVGFIAPAADAIPSVEPTSVVDEWTAAATDLSVAVALDPAAAAADPYLHAAANESTPTTDLVGSAVESVLVADPVSAEPLPVAAEPVLAADALEAAVESMLIASDSVAEHTLVGTAIESVADPAPTSASVDPVAVVHEPAVAIDTVAADFEPVLVAEPDLDSAAVESFANEAQIADEPVETVVEPMYLAEQPVAAGVAIESELVTAAVDEAIVLPAEPVGVDSALALDEAGAAVEPIEAMYVQEPVADAPPASAAAPTADDIAMAFDPSLTADTVVSVGEPSLGADVAPSAAPILTDEPVVTVDPAVFDLPPVATAESELPGDISPAEEPPATDVEYEVSPEDLTSSDPTAPNEEEISLVGETSVEGDVSLVGDESLSGGPAVEVEEFAFDELPALDEAGHEKLAGTDEPPSPGEESDD